ncbi:MAG: substrate-binding domain-containing protein [Chitinispirillaceae bacterium]|nr:substrate-binding domain-containing protein [Chitinispirillaceae bacterium]
MRLLGKAISLLVVSVALFIPHTNAAAPKVIGVSLLSREHQFYKDLESGLQSEAAKAHYKLVVTAGEFDPARQASQIEDFIAQKVDAIVLAPCDSKAAGNSILGANKAKIPVFTVDIASISSQGKVVSHIASDNREGGRLAGKLIATAINGKGKVVIINHPGVTSVLDRVAGFREALAAYPNISIIADVPAWGQRDKAMSAMEDMLLKVPDVSAVFGINDDSALGALAAVEAAGKKTVIVGYDAIPEAKKAIADGKIYGDVIQSPKKIGVLAIKTIADYFAGKTVPATVPVPVGVWTKESK